MAAPTAAVDDQIAQEMAQFKQQRAQGATPPPPAAPAPAAPTQQPGGPPVLPDERGLTNGQMGIGALPTPAGAAPPAPPVTQPQQPPGPGPQLFGPHGVFPMVPNMQAPMPGSQAAQAAGRVPSIQPLTFQQTAAEANLAAVDAKFRALTKAAPAFATALPAGVSGPGVQPAPGGPLGQRQQQDRWAVAQAGATLPALRQQMQTIGQQLDRDTDSLRQALDLQKKGLLGPRDTQILQKQLATYQQNAALYNQRLKTIAGIEGRYTAMKTAAGDTPIHTGMAYPEEQKTPAWKALLSDIWGSVAFTGGGQADAQRMNAARGALMLNGQYPPLPALPSWAKTPDQRQAAIGQKNEVLSVLRAIPGQVRDDGTLDQSGGPLNPNRQGWAEVAVSKFTPWQKQLVPTLKKQLAAEEQAGLMSKQGLGASVDVMLNLLTLGSGRGLGPVAERLTAPLGRLLEARVAPSIAAAVGRIAPAAVDPVKQFIVEGIPRVAASAGVGATIGGGGAGTEAAVGGAKPLQVAQAAGRGALTGAGLGAAGAIGMEAAPGAARAVGAAWDEARTPGLISKATREAERRYGFTGDEVGLYQRRLTEIARSSLSRPQRMQLLSDLIQDAKTAPAAGGNRFAHLEFGEGAPAPSAPAAAGASRPLEFEEGAPAAARGAPAGANRLLELEPGRAAPSAAADPGTGRLLELGEARPLPPAAETAAPGGTAAEGRFGKLEPRTPARTQPEPEAAAEAGQRGVRLLQEPETRAPTARAAAAAETPAAITPETLRTVRPEALVAAATSGAPMQAPATAAAIQNHLAWHDARQTQLDAAQVPPDQRTAWADQWNDVSNPVRHQHDIVLQASRKMEAANPELAAKLAAAAAEIESSARYNFAHATMPGNDQQAQPQAVAPPQVSAWRMLTPEEQLAVPPVVRRAMLVQDLSNSQQVMQPQAPFILPGQRLPQISDAKLEQYADARYQEAQAHLAANAPNLLAAPIQDGGAQIAPVQAPVGAQAPQPPAAAPAQQVPAQTLQAPQEAVQLRGAETAVAQAVPAAQAAAVPVERRVSQQRLPAGVERRVNVTQRKAIEEMSPEEQAAEIRQLREVERIAYTDRKSGVWNDEAWAKTPHKAHISVLDIDGLGYLNDSYGHKAGDALIVATGDTLRKVGLAEDAFRTGGDEFTIHSDDLEDLQKRLELARRVQENTVVSYTGEDGKKRSFKGLSLSFGIGKSEGEADAKLYEDKAQRTAAGRRATGKGKLPPTAEHPLGAPNPAARPPTLVEVGRRGGKVQAGNEPGSAAPAGQPDRGVGQGVGPAALTEHDLRAGALVADRATGKHFELYRPGTEFRGGVETRIWHAHGIDPDTGRRNFEDAELSVPGLLREFGHGRLRGEEAGTAPAPQAAVPASGPREAAARPAPSPAGKTAKAAGETEAAVAPAAEGVDTSFRVGDERVNGRWAIYDIGKLVTSHTDELNPNPAYPAELQPRERSRQAGREQVAHLAQHFDPTLMGENPLAQHGAPIIGPDGVVESGNGRIITLRILYDQKEPAAAAAYRKWLDSVAPGLGIETKEYRGARQPILVRTRTTPMTEAERVQFTRAANARETAAMGAAEQGKVDAERLTPEMMRLFDPGESGELTAATNRPFLRAFIGALPTAEQGALRTSEGTVSQEGLRRIRNAVFQHVYGDADALERLSEALDDPIRNVTGALLRSAGFMADLKAGIDAGTAYPVSIVPDLMEAVRKLATLREGGRSVGEFLAQIGMFGQDLTPLQRDILVHLDTNKRSAKRIAATLADYKDLAVKAGDPSSGILFEDRAPPEKATLWKAAVNRTTVGEQDEPGLFTKAEPAVTPAAQASAAKAVRGAVQTARRAKPAQGARPATEAVAPAAAYGVASKPRAAKPKESGRKGGEVRSWDETFPPAARTVDGREVRTGPVPNTDSIEASLDDYTVLQGIRSVATSLFGTGFRVPLGGPADDLRRAQELAEQIKASGELTPLIVVEDKNGPYILEGGHRFDALAILNAKAFPALVVLDDESLARGVAVSESGKKSGEVAAPARSKAYWKRLRKIGRAGGQRFLEARVRAAETERQEAARLAAAAWRQKPTPVPFEQMGRAGAARLREQAAREQAERAVRYQQMGQKGGAEFLRQRTLPAPLGTPPGPLAAPSTEEPGRNLPMVRTEPEHAPDAAYSVYKAGQIVEKLPEPNKALERAQFLWNALTRDFPHLPPGATYGELKHMLRQFRSMNEIAGMQAQIRMAETLRGLEEDPEQYDLFNFALFARNLVAEAARQQRVIDANGGKGQIRLPADLTPQEAQDAADYVDSVLPAYPNVQRALEQRAKVLNEVTTRFLDTAERVLGHRPFEQLQDYFHQEAVEALRPGHSGPMAGRRPMQMPSRDWLKHREGSTGLYNTNWIQAEFKVLSQMIADTRRLDLLDYINRRYSITKRIKEEAERQGVDWKRLIPEGYQEVRLEPNSLFYRVGTPISRLIEGDVAQQLKELGVEPVLLVGKDRLPLVLPTELAKTLRDMGAAAAQNFQSEWQGLLRGLQRPWKAYQVTAPHRMIGFQLRKEIGELEVAMVNMGTYGKMGQSIREVAAFGTRSGRAAGPIAPELNEWMERGGWHSLLNAMEHVGSGDKLRLLSDFVADDRNVVQKGIDHIWGRLRLAMDLRETATRYAIYLSYLDQMLHSSDGRPNNFGYSDPREIMAIRDPRDRAYKLSDEVAGAYGSQSQAVQFLADTGLPVLGANPFFRFQSVNVSRFARGIRNMPIEIALARARAGYLPKGTPLPGPTIPIDMLPGGIDWRTPRAGGPGMEPALPGGGGGGSVPPEGPPGGAGAEDAPPWYDPEVAGRVSGRVLGKALLEAVKHGVGPLTVYMIGKFLLRSNMVQGALLWSNRHYFPKELEDLPSYVRGHPVLILGRDKQGNVIYSSRLSAIEEVYSYGGLDNAMGHWEDFINGRKTRDEVVADMLKEGAGHFLQGGPAMSLMELWMGKSAFPSPFSPRTIQNPARFIFESFGLGSVYDRYTQTPQKPGAWWTAFALHVAPKGEAAYDDLRGMTRDFLQSKGKGDPGDRRNTKGAAMYNYKRALQYNDVNAAAVWLLHYEAAGGTRKGMEESMKSMDPLARLSKAEQQEFILSLSAHDRDRLLNAYHYFAATMAPDAKLAQPEGRPYVRQIQHLQTRIAAAIDREALQHKELLEAQHLQSRHEREQKQVVRGALQRAGLR